MNKKLKYFPPLAVHFVWHPSNQSTIFPFIEEFRRYLTRDIDRPFSRELNIPTFLYSTNNPKLPPRDKPQKLAEKDVIFLFTSINTLACKHWREYIESIPNSVENKTYIVPVAIDRDSLGHGSSGILENFNFVRAFEWPIDRYFEQGILALSHELYRYGIKAPNKQQQGNNSSIKLFISHAKKGETGLRHAKALKEYIDSSNMQNFFDTYSISPAFRFDEEIEKYIQSSTIIAINCDAYSSRYWCQREILCAKKERRPIIAVNSLEHYEDRIFPPAANIPCVHVASDIPINLKDILRILIAAILETIRFKYSLELLKFYQDQHWIDANAHLCARPPEIQQVVALQKEQNQNKNKNEKLIVCYPEPPLYAEETEWTDHLNVIVSTPLWNSTEDNTLSNQRIGLSISDYPANNYEHQHLHLDELKRFSQVLSRHLLARGKTLVYGGDLRDDGFTQFVLDEAAVVRDRLQIKKLHVENHLAWPLHLLDENTQWRAKYVGLLDTIDYRPPSDVRELVDENTFLQPNCLENKYIWSRCLTEMRKKSIQQCDARIFAGGKINQYMGKMPGILEEFLIAYNEQKPIYLVGGLGGITTIICRSLLTKTIADELTEQWQITNNNGYRQHQIMAEKYNQHVDYTEIKKLIYLIDISTLAQQTGLTAEEYKRLMQTPFINECVHLILKGLRNIY